NGRAFASLGELGGQLIRLWVAREVPGFALLTAREIHAAAAASTRVSLREEVALVGSQLPTLLGENTPSSRRIMSDVGRWFQRLEFVGLDRLASVTTTQVEDFVREAVRVGDRWFDPSPSTMRGRRTAVRLVLRVARTLHLIEATFDPTA